MVMPCNYLDYDGGNHDDGGEKEEEEEGSGGDCGDGDDSVLLFIEFIMSQVLF